MAQVTCQICKKKIEKEHAFLVEKGKVNNYYCSEEAYMKHSLNMKKFHEVQNYLAYEILDYEETGNFSNLISKRLKQLNKTYDYDIIKLTLESNRDFLKFIATIKEFSTYGQRVNYLMAVVDGEIKEVYKKWKDKKQFEEKMATKKDESLPLFLIDELPTTLKPTDVKNESSGITRFLGEDDL